MRDENSTAVIRVNNISKYYFLQIKEKADLSSADTLEFICNFFIDNYDDVMSNKNSKKDNQNGSNNR